MTKLEQIKNEVAGLAEEERVELMDWLAVSFQGDSVMHALLPELRRRSAQARRDFASLGSWDQAMREVEAEHGLAD